MKKYSEEELKMLSTSTGLRYLLKGNKPDFDKVLHELKLENRLTDLQEELIKLQYWVVDNNERLMILIEGREFAGKGGLIRALTDHLNPRHMRKVALPKPSQREMGQWYFQRYIQRLPDPGEMVFFDRSWYNRAMVEPVNGFCTKEEYDKFMKEVNHFERMIVEDNIRLFKFYLSISKKEQIQRIEEVRDNDLRKWELTKVDERSVILWNKYTKFKNWMFQQTDTEIAPWAIIKADDRTQTYIHTIEHILENTPYNGKKKYKNNKK